MYTKKQIEAIKQLKASYPIKFHGNRKQWKGLPVELFSKIVEKKLKRMLQSNSHKQTDFEIVKDCIKWSKKCKGTNYFKIMIEGNTGIYYAHPGYRHSDYNKSRLFDKSEKTLKLMHIFNSIILK